MRIDDQSLSLLIQKQASESEFQDEPTTLVEKPALVVESLKEDPDAGWPSFGRLIIDLFKLAFEVLGNIFLYFIPLSLKRGRSKKGLTPLKDTLLMPEDKVEPPPSVQKHRSPSPLTESLDAPIASTMYTQQKPQKVKTASLKDPSLSGKHRSLKRQDFSEFYGPGENPPYSHLGSKSQKERMSSSEAPQYGPLGSKVQRDRMSSGEAPQYSQFGSKSLKERTRHRHRDKSGEAVLGPTAAVPKSVEMKSEEYSDPKFNLYNSRIKHGTDDLFRF
ncbi:hypothetical protein ACLOJK_008694 [Asimina triloba]